MKPLHRSSRTPNVSGSWWLAQLVLLPALVVSLHAGPRISANYSIVTDSADDGGGAATSASYASLGSANAIGGPASALAPAGIAKTGYVAQLFEVTSLAINSATPTVNETEAVQLGAWQLLDDDTYLALDANNIAWSIASGPLTDISGGGLVTAGPVFQDTIAGVQADFGGFTASLQLTVLDTIADNFGAYAGDGIADAWQVQYFGPDNPLAAPDADADGDGQNNLLEFLAGSAPDDPASQFETSGTAVGGGVFTMQLSRVQPGTRYIFQRSTDFVTWTDILTLDPDAVATPFTQPLPTNGPQDFFRVRLEAAP